MDHTSPDPHPEDHLEVAPQAAAAEERLLSLLLGSARGGMPEEAWRRVESLAVQHGVAELLYYRLSQQGSTVPSAYLQPLHQRYLVSAARNAFYFHELANLLSELHQRQIPVIVLKGAFLAEKIYQNIAARPMGDIDLLIQEDDQLEVDAVLLSLGYQHQFHSLERTDEAHALPYHHPQTGLVVEIHWVLMNVRYGMQADTSQLWQRASAVDLAGMPALRLSPEDQILHLCVHASVHVFEMGLKAVCDLDGVIRHYEKLIDWDCLHQRAYQWRAERCVYVNLRLACELMQTPISREWLSRITPADFEERYYRLAKHHLFYSVENPQSAIPDAAGVVRFWSEGKWYKKLGIFLKRVFPSREEMSRMYPAQADSLKIYLYYPVRAVDLLQRFGKLGVRLLAGDRHTLARARRQDEVNDLRDYLITRQPEPPGV
ncbi:MAG: nucleotidyltransferase family protein [Anaerolineales bacterium]|jgi:hypothetical protein|nr:nucleotidyltransferase family protein [Anaerolineales bacterium]